MRFDHLILSEEGEQITGRTCGPVPPRIARRLAICSIICLGARRVPAGAFMTAPDSSAVADQPSVSRNRLVLVVYTSAIFTSALLLFSVQPLFTKMVLPRLGGSPAV